MDVLAKSKQKTTLNQLVDVWRGVGKQFAGISKENSVGKEFNRDDCEKIVITLLIQDILKQDFHHTPYSTISYLKKGFKAPNVVNGNEKVFVTFLEVQKKTKSKRKNDDKRAEDSENLEFVKFPGEKSTQKKLNSEKEKGKVSPATQKGKNRIIDDIEDDDGMAVFQQSEANKKKVIINDDFEDDQDGPKYQLKREDYGDFEDDEQGYGIQNHSNGHQKPKSPQKSKQQLKQEKRKRKRSYDEDYDEDFVDKDDDDYDDEDYMDGGEEEEEDPDDLEEDLNNVDQAHKVAQKNNGKEDREKEKEKGKVKLDHANQKTPQKTLSVNESLSDDDFVKPAKKKKS